MYGHPDSGAFWEKHCEAQLKLAGFISVPNWSSCFKHPKLKLILLVYVDDFKLSGPTKSLPIGWRLFVDSGIVLEEELPPGLFLGCIHERLETVINGIAARGFAYDMEACLLDSVKRYCELVLWGANATQQSN